MGVPGFKNRPTAHSDRLLRQIITYIHTILYCKAERLLRWTLNPMLPVRDMDSWEICTRITNTSSNIFNFILSSNRFTSPYILKWALKTILITRESLYLTKIVIDYTKLKKNTRWWHDFWHFKNVMGLLTIGPSVSSWDILLYPGVHVYLEITQIGIHSHD